MSDIITKNITLELERTGVQTRIPARQGDSRIRKIVISLNQNGRRMNVPGVEWAGVTAKLPGGDVIFADCRAEPNGSYSFIPGAGFFSECGSVVCRLVLRGGDGRELYSPSFAIDSEGYFGTGFTDAVPASEYSRLGEMLGQVLTAKRECEAVLNEMKLRERKFLDQVAKLTIDTAGTSDNDFKYTAEGGITVSLVAQNELKINFPESYKRLSMLSIQPGYTVSSGTAVGGLEIRINGERDVLCNLATFCNVNVRRSTLYIDTKDPYSCFVSSGITDDTNFGVRYYMYNAPTHLKDVEGISSIDLTLTGRPVAFLDGGVLNFYGEK